MSLTSVQSKILNTVVTDDVAAKLAAAPREQQRDILIEAIDDHAIAGFIEASSVDAFLYIRAEAISGYSKELRVAYGLPAQSATWPWEVPIAGYKDLVSRKELLEELSAVPKHLDFADAHDVASIAAAIRSVLNIGGLQDASDPTAIPLTDPTMQLLIRLVQRQLPDVYPHWAPEGVLEDTLPADANPMSLYELDLYAQASKLAHRKDEARARRDAKRKKLVEEAAARRSAIQSVLLADENFVSVIAKLNTLSFEELREKIEAVGKALFDNYSVALGAPSLLDFLQVVYRQLPPSYFRSAAEGDIRLRDVAPKPKSTVRRDKAILTALAKLVAKYGYADTKQVVELTLAAEETLVAASAEYAKEAAAEAAAEAASEA